MDFISFVRQIFQGKTIYRILLHRQVRRHCAHVKGEVLDLASGGNPSYFPYLPHGVKLIKTDYREGKGIDRMVDLNKPLPFPDGSVGNILLFNAIYIVKDRVQMLLEIHRVLKKGGAAYVVSPFIANEMPEPDDFCRLTYQGLEREFREAGFKDIEIVRFGERFTAAAYLSHPFFMLNIIRFIAYSLALCLDRTIPKRVKREHPVPLGYFCILKK